MTGDAKMAIITTASALPAKGSWGSFARSLLERLASRCERYQQRRIMLAVGELDHSDALADMQAAMRRRDTARTRGIFEGHSVMIPEGKSRSRLEG